MEEAISLHQNIDSGEEPAEIHQFPSTSHTELVESTEEPSLTPKFVCNLCENERFQNEKRSPTRFLRPCLCDIKIHHGCMVDYLKFHKKCPACEVEYRYYKYGSTWHFVKRYWYQFLAISLLSIVLISLGSFLVFVGFPSDSFGTFLLLVLGTMCLIFGCVIFFKFYVFMFRKRFPRFKKRYSNTTVFEFNPNQIAKKNKFKGLP